MNSRRWNRILLVPVGMAVVFAIAAIGMTIFGWRPINPGADLLLALAVGLSLIITLMLMLPDE